MAEAFGLAKNIKIRLIVKSLCPIFMYLRIAHRKPISDPKTDEIKTEKTTVCTPELDDVISVCQWGIFLLLLGVDF